MTTSPPSPDKNRAAAIDAEGYDALDRALRDSFPTSDAPSATVIIRVGCPAPESRRGFRRPTGGSA